MALPPPPTSRPRVTAAIAAAVASAPVVVVEGLPRNGRSTALRHAAAELPAPVRWIGPRVHDRDEGRPRTVVVDDAHRLPADVVADLVRRAVDRDDLHLVLLARGALELDRRRLREDGRLAEVGPAVLDWRPWEVERLLRAAGVALPPPLVERLTTGTAGWTALVVEAVAGLAEEPDPSRAVAGVLAAVDSTRRALVGAAMTAATPEVTRAVAAALAGDAPGVDGTEAALQAGLVVRVGGRLAPAPAALPALVPADAPAHWASRAQRLVEEGDWAQALVAAAQDGVDEPVRERVVAAVARGVSGPLRPEDGVPLLGVPQRFVDASPWTCLAAARAAVVAGRPHESMRRYDALLAAAPPAEVEERARRERSALPFFAGGAALDGPEWVLLLQQAVAGEPGQVVARALTSWEPAERLAGQLAQLLADGRHADLARPTGRLRHGAWLGVLALLVEAVTMTLQGRPPDAAALHALADRCARGGQPWASRAAAAVAELVDGSAPPTGWFAATAAAERDRWGELLARFVDGLTWLRTGDVVSAAREMHASAALADAAGAPVLALWARALALLWCGDRSTPPSVLLARARALGVPGAVRLLEEQEASAGGPAPAPPRPEEPVHGSPPSAPPAARAAARAQPAVALRCLGAPALLLAGAPAPRGLLKPRHRALLHLLGARSGQPVHREELVDALWPAAPELPGLRGLQVAVSAVRQALGRVGQAGALQRDGEAYLLVPGPDVVVDVADFGTAAEHGLSAVRAGRCADAEPSLSAALALYRGDLLVGERAADWLLRERDLLRARAVAVARALAETRLELARPHQAVDAAERGLVVDPYDDGLWRALVRAHRAAGNTVACRRTEERYHAVLAELGAPVTAPRSPSPR